MMVATPNTYESALKALVDAGVAIRLRKDFPLAGGPASYGELDILLQPGEITRADAAMKSAGFHHLVAPQAPDHRFYLCYQADRWLKVDAKLAGHRRSSFSRYRPAGLRRLGPVVAILGPDGVGKSAIISRLVEEIPVGATVAYLGWIPRRKRGVRPVAPASPDSAERIEASGSISPLRECAFVVLHALRFLPRLARVYLSAWRGYIVICDRHPVELLAIRPRQTASAAALERLIWRRLIPWPDAIVLLDAPAAVLSRRKDEHPPHVLEGWRRAYHDVFGSAASAVISTTDPVETSVRLVAAAAWEELKRRRRW